jgi:hypothetical protein
MRRRNEESTAQGAGHRSKGNARMDISRLRGRKRDRGGMRCGLFTLFTLWIISLMRRDGTLIISRRHMVDKPKRPDYL